MRVIACSVDLRYERKDRRSATQSTIGISRSETASERMWFRAAQGGCGSERRVATPNVRLSDLTPNMHMST
jgi:hypothetical protein